MIKLTIGERLRLTDIDTYKQLMQIGRRHNKKEIELGDRPENFMKHRSYKRIGRRIRQIKWG